MQPRPEHFLQSRQAAWIVLVVSVLMTFMAWSLSKSYLERDAYDRFDAVAQLTRRNIEQRMAVYQNILRAGAGFIYGSDSLSRQHWKTFVDSLQLDLNYPGIQGLGYSVMLTAEQIPEIERKIAAEGFADFTIHPPGQRDRYSAIIYLEPFDWRNQRAFGYDMFSEPVRREAMERARDNAEIALSAPVILVQETEQQVQQGVLLYHPIYRQGLPTATVDQRRKALMAFVYSPFRIADLMGGTLGLGQPQIEFELYDGEQATPEKLLFRSNALSDANNTGLTATEGLGSRSPRFITMHRLDIGGRRWTARFISTPHFETIVSSIQPTLIAMGGIATDLLLFVGLMVSYRHRQNLAFEIERFHLALKSAPVAMLMVDCHNRITLANQTAESLFGYADSELLGQSIDRLIPSVSADIQAAFLNHCLAAEYDHRLGAGKETLGLRRDSIEIEIEIGFSLVDGFSQQYVIAAIGNITERKKHQHALAESEERYRGVIETSPDGFFMAKRNGLLISVNSSYCKMSGYSRQQLLQMAIPDLEALETPDETALHLQKIRQQGYDRFETRHRRKDGSHWPVEITVSTIPTGEEMFVFARDLTEIKLLEAERLKVEEAIREMAFYDPLTKLPNRRLLADRIKQTMMAGRRNRHHSALLFIDLDKFKELNDSLGHDFGDMLLVEVAQRLTACVRSEDTVARLGGDEFVIILTSLAEDTQASVAQVRQVGRKILEALNEPYQLEQHIHFCTPSIGATLFLDDQDTMEAIFKRADHAMYQVKASGRNALRLHDFDVSYS